MGARMQSGFMVALALSAWVVGPPAARASEPEANAFAAIDANANGELTYGEIERVAPRLFAALDRDGDDKVTLPELTAYGFEANTPLSRAARDAAFVLEPEFTFTDLDGDQDGAISADEFADHITALGRALDSNNDGAVTPEEFTLAPIIHDPDVLAGR